MFDPTSRYFRVREARCELDSRDVIYKRRRFLPRRDTVSGPESVTVVDHDRLDLIAAARIGDPELFWHICDANDTLNPFELTEEVGRRLRLPGSYSG